MGLKDKSEEILSILKEMGEAFHQFQKEAQLECPPGCGKCCLFPDIESTPLECLPLAYDFYQKGELDTLKSLTENAGLVCALWQGDEQTGKGRCTVYEVRPSICRIFGVGGYFDKNRKVTLSVCKLIKENSPEKIRAMSQNRTAENTPMIAHWYTRIQALGNADTLRRLQINEAISEAIKLVEFYSQYE